MPRSELFLGNLSRDVTQRDIEDVFDKYGKVIRCEVKNKGFGAVYAFLEFEDERDAEDALKNENGKDMCGSSMVVEFAKGKGVRSYRGGSDRDGDRYGYGRNGFSRGGRGGSSRSLECYQCGERGHFARDCRNRRDSGRRSDRDRDRDRDRYSSRRDRSRDRSRDRDRDSGRSDRDRDRDRDRRDRGGGGGERRHHSRSPSNHSRTKSRSRSPSYDNKNRNRSIERSVKQDNHNDISME